METAREILQFLHYHPSSSREDIRAGIAFQESDATLKRLIGAGVRTRSIPFTISAEEDQARKRALEAFYAPHPETPEMTLEEINEEIRAARSERKERLAKEGKI